MFVNEMAVPASRAETVEREDLEYPEPLLRYLGASAPERLIVLGDRSKLSLPLMGIFGSIRTPPGMVLRALDLARALRDRRVPVAGGFQTPLERDMLRMLIRGSQPIVIGVDRRVEGMRIPRPWQPAHDRGQLLVVGSGANRWRRATVSSATHRNRILAAIATRILIVHARAGSRTFRLAAQALEWGKQVYCIDHPANRDLQLLGAQPVREWKVALE